MPLLKNADHTYMNVYSNGKKKEDEKACNDACLLDALNKVMLYKQDTTDNKKWEMLSNKNNSKEK